MSLSTEEKYCASIENVYAIIKKMGEEYGIDFDKTIASFWDMFVVDCLIGNQDRHLGNWGFIKKGNTLTFAPIYDCGSALHPLLSEEKQEEYRQNPVAFKNLAYNVTSVYSFHDKKIFYHEIFKMPPKDLKDGIKRIVPKIDMTLIKDIIFKTEGLTQGQKEFYYKDILMRKEEVLDKALKSI